MSQTSLRSETSFRHYKASHFLKSLASTPFDLTVPGNLSAERIERYCAHAGEFKLLYATERVNDDVLHALKELASEAHLIDKMKAMQEGAVINKIEGYPSENRICPSHCNAGPFLCSPLVRLQQKKQLRLKNKSVRN